MLFRRALDTKHATLNWNLEYLSVLLTTNLTLEKRCLNTDEGEFRRALGAQAFSGAIIKMAELSIFFSSASKISNHLDDSEEATKNVTDDKVNSSLLL